MKQKSNERNSIGDCTKGEVIIQHPYGTEPNIFQVIEIISGVSYTTKSLTDAYGRKGKIDTYPWSYWQNIHCRLLTDDEKIQLL
jgi:hypothetical protein